MNTEYQDRKRLLLSKVPEVTAYFWVIKVLCTTVGESAADFLNVNLGFGLGGTSVATGVLLLVVLAFQFRADRYLPALYWLTVALVSVFGTLVTDNLTDQLGVPLETSTVIFAVLLAATFVAWYAAERTLSIHSIRTRRREAFYWLAILFTFALGTATGDLMAEVLGLGYLAAGLIVAGLIAVIAVAWRVGLHPVLAFWFAYVLTRPLGASLGDYLSQPADQGGLGLGATVTSAVFGAGIVGVVVLLSVTKVDRNPSAAETETRGGLRQTVAVVVIVLALSVTGYYLRTSALQHDTVPTAPGAPPSARLGDLSSFRTITRDTLDRLNSGDQSGATSRVDDLETAWDQAQARLKPRDPGVWTDLDDKIDTVLTDLRATNPDPAAEKTALQALLTALG
ncbi:hypothetical protein [Actinokineospora inagensis]|uniref:COG4705 family protein n=1 Tax=Actinokineospora inagensis TaxID=103730 RepID=UPI000415F6C5|nr:hypothetical protein [Actinokineospora inagensis]